jgi:hypothetical protein
MTKSRNIHAPHIQWTDWQIDQLNTRYANERTQNIANDIGVPLAKVYAQASRLGLSKSAEYLASPAAGRTNGFQGRGTRFVKGHQTWNKGTHFTAGGRSAETRFKKGSMSGAAQHNYVPVGSLRVNCDGYIERKMSDDPALAPARRWIAVHRLVWIEANGELPKDHIVVFKRGMRTNKLEEITLDKVELISRAENMKRNTIHNYPKEIVQLHQLRGAINRKINRMEKQNDADK